MPPSVHKTPRRDNQAPSDATTTLQPSDNHPTRDAMALRNPFQNGVERLDLRIRKRRDLKTAMKALRLLKRGNVVVRHVRIGHSGDPSNLDGRTVTTLLTAVYDVLAEGGTIDISLKESPVLPFWAINHWNTHIPTGPTGPTPPRAGPLFFNGCSFGRSSDDQSQPMDSAVAAMPLTDQDFVVPRMMEHFRLLAARTIQRWWRKLAGDPYGTVGKRVLLYWFNREQAPLKKRQRLE